MAKKLKSATKCDKIFYSSIPNDVKGYKYVRLNNVPGNPSWDRKWNETGDLSLTSQTEFKLSDGNGNGSLQNKTCDEIDSDCGNTGDGDDDDDDTSDCDYIEVWCKGSQSYVTDSFGVQVNDRANVATEEGKYQTSVEKVFTAGDMHRGQSLVVWAIREGREVAKAVDEYLMGYTNLR